MAWISSNLVRLDPVLLLYATGDSTHDFVLYCLSSFDFLVAENLSSFSVQMVESALAN